MRRTLDGLYAAGLLLAAIAMVGIGVLVLLQVAGRVIDRFLVFVGSAPLGLAIPSLAEFGGFLFVAAASLALPATLRAGQHVRVTFLALALRPGPAQRVLETAVLVGAAGLAGFASWHSGLQALDSWQFGSLSYGMIPVPLWIPQGAMTVGLALLLVSLVDELVALLRGDIPAFRQAELGRARSGLTKAPSETAERNQE